MENEIITFSSGLVSLTARISCEIDHHTASRLRARIDRELFVERPRMLYLDFSEVRFMDSSGIALILGRVERASSLRTSVRHSFAAPVPSCSVLIVISLLHKDPLERNPGWLMI